MRGAGPRARVDVLTRKASVVGARSTAGDASTAKPFAMPAASTWTPECLRRAVDEVRALSCMFGDGASPAEDPTAVSDPESLLELAESALDAAEAGAGSSPGENALHAVPALEVTIKLLGDRLRGGGVDVVVRMPPGYPAFRAAEIRAEGNARATLDDLDRLRRAAESAVAEVGEGEESALSGVEAVRRAVAELAESAAAERAAAADAAAAAATTAAMGSRRDQTLARRLIWFHHIKAPGKRKAAQSWAKELDLGGFSKPGYPGIIVIEGRAEDCEAYVSRLKRLTWKAMSVRVAEEDDAVVSERGGLRRLPAAFEELPENGLGIMGEALREAGLEHMLEAALKQRTVKWTG